MDLKNENRVEVLRETALTLHDEVLSLRRQLAQYKTQEGKESQRVLELEEILQGAQRKLYGRSSERQSRPKSNPSTAKQTGHGPTEQPELVTVDEVHELDEADLTCPECGKALQAWKDQFELSEMIDVELEKFLLKKIHRQKYRCGCGHIETALGPDKLVPGGRYSKEVAIDVAVKKYSDHLPLDRQVRISQRAGLKVTSQSLWDQIYALYEKLKPVGARLLAHLHQKTVLGIDETTWHLLKKSSKKHYVWALCGDDAVLYHIADTRGTKGAIVLLEGYENYLISDDYSVYRSLDAKAEWLFVLLACWAHVRRKFFEALTNEPIRAQAVIDLIGELYRIDERTVGPPGSDEQLQSRHELRQTYSVPVIEALRHWAFKTYDVLPKSAFGKALEYMRSCFIRLEVFLQDPRLALDNNATERSVRGVVVGRKNHYGSKSKRGTEVAALLYSLIESAKLAGICPREYLKSALIEAMAGRQIPLPHEVRAQIA